MNTHYYLNICGDIFFIYMRLHYANQKGIAEHAP